MFCEPAFSKMLQKMLMTMSPVASGTSWSYLQSCTVLESDFDSDLDQITLLPSPDNMHNSPLRNFRKNIGWYTSLLLMTLITIILVKYLINVFSFYFLHTHIKYHIWYTICLRSHPCPGYCIFCHHSICKIG